MLLDLSELVTAGRAVPEEEGCDQAEPQMRLSDGLDGGVGVEEVDDCALPASRGREGEEEEEHYLCH